MFRLACTLNLNRNLQLFASNARTLSITSLCHCKATKKKKKKDLTKPDTDSLTTPEKQHSSLPNPEEKKKKIIDIVNTSRNIQTEHDQTGRQSRPQRSQMKKEVNITQLEQLERDMKHQPDVSKLMTAINDEKNEELPTRRKKRGTAKPDTNSLTTPEKQNLSLNMVQNLAKDAELNMDQLEQFMAEMTQQKSSLRHLLKNAESIINQLEQLKQEKSSLNMKQQRDTQDVTKIMTALIDEIDEELSNPEEKIKTLIDIVNTNRNIQTEHDQTGRQSRPQRSQMKKEVNITRLEQLKREMKHQPDVSKLTTAINDEKNEELPRRRKKRGTAKPDTDSLAIPEKEHLSVSFLSKNVQADTKDQQDMQDVKKILTAVIDEIDEELSNPEEKIKNLIDIVNTRKNIQTEHDQTGRQSRPQRSQMKKEVNITQLGQLKPDMKHQPDNVSKRRKKKKETAKPDTDSLAIPEKQHLSVSFLSKNFQADTKDQQDDVTKILTAVVDEIDEELPNPEEKIKKLMDVMSSSTNVQRTPYNDKIDKKDHGNDKRPFSKSTTGQTEREQFVSLDECPSTRSFPEYNEMFSENTHEMTLYEENRLKDLNNMISKGIPLNSFQVMLQDTDDDWKFPIDNQQDMGIEEETTFAEHIFLSHFLDRFPDIEPIQKFMELVITGLQQNPYLSVDEKKSKIMWYKEYFDKFPEEELT